jgi:2-succinyl-5-enolpyruvyl-6-hydroxy-3-cyclohexene-1-carboxylate synthase
MVLAFDALDKVKCHVVLDERAAGFIALGIARATGQPALVLCTSGSAGTHYLPAVVEASSSRVPLLVMTADRPLELHHCGASQTMDQNHLFGRQVRWFLDLSAPSSEIPDNWLRMMVSQAMDRALSGPPGPVHINVHFRKPFYKPQKEQALLSPIHAEERKAPPAVIRGENILGEAEVTRLAERLSQYPRGVIVAGLRTPDNRNKRHNPEYSDAISRLAERLGWPVLAEITSGIRFGRHDQSQVITTYDAFLRSEDLGCALAPEIILRFGQAPCSSPLNQWLFKYGMNRTIAVDEYGAWHDPGHALDTLVVASPTLLCRQLTDAVTPFENKGWLSRWYALDQATQEVCRHDLFSGRNATGENRLWEGAVARTMIDCMPGGALLLAGSSMPIRDLDGFSHATNREIAVQSNRGVNGIDGLVSTALGMSIGWSSGPTLGLIGDLTALHDLDGLAAAKNLGTNLTLVINNNSGGGIFGFLPISQNAEAYEKFFLTPQNVDLGSICEALGIHHVKVEDVGGLVEAIKGDLERPGIGLVEAVIDREYNISLHQLLWDTVAERCAIVEAA